MGSNLEYPLPNYNIDLEKKYSNHKVKIKYLKNSNNNDKKPIINFNYNLFRCSNCLAIPLIYILPNKDLNYDIYYYCYCETEIKKYNINNFIKDFLSNTIEQVFCDNNHNHNRIAKYYYKNKLLCEKCILRIENLHNINNIYYLDRIFQKCLNHQNEENYSYCLVCNLNFCKKCKNIHSEHHKIKFKQLNDLINEESIKSFLKNKIVLIYKDFTTKIINFIKSLDINKELMNNIQKLIDIFYNNNIECLKIIQFIYYSFTINKNNINYEIIENLSLNTKFKANLNFMKTFEVKYFDELKFDFKNKEILEKLKKFLYKFMILDDNILKIKKDIIFLFYINLNTQDKLVNNIINLNENKIGYLTNLSFYVSDEKFYREINYKESLIMFDIYNEIIDLIYIKNIDSIIFLKKNGGLSKFNIKNKNFIDDYYNEEKIKKFFLIYDESQDENNNNNENKINEIFNDEDKENFIGFIPLKNDKIFYILNLKTLENKKFPLEFEFKIIDILNYSKDYIIYFLENSEIGLISIKNFEIIKKNILFEDFKFQFSSNFFKINNNNILIKLDENNVCYVIDGEKLNIINVINLKFSNEKFNSVVELKDKNILIGTNFGNIYLFKYENNNYTNIYFNNITPINGIKKIIQQNNTENIIILDENYNLLEFKYSYYNKCNY